MQALRTHEDVLEAEQALLRSLCQQLFERARHKEIVGILAGYKWQSGEHQILFEILHGSPTASAEGLREQLPAILTRKGFPEVNVESYFVAEAVSAAEALGVARALVALTCGEH